MPKLAALRIIGWTTFLLAYMAVAILQATFDANNVEFKKAYRRIIYTYPEPLVLPTPVLKAISLGNYSLAADILWLQTIQYFGGTDSNLKHPALSPFLDSITQLDPRFEYPYEFALTVLPYMNATPMAITLGERAQLSLPGRGLITYYLASTYMLNLKDYKKAAFYYEKAAGEAGAPSSAKKLAGINYTKVRESLDDRLVALLYWETVFKNAKSEDEKKWAGDWFVQMQIVYELERAAAEYKKQYGNYPVNFQALIENGLITQVPASPIGRVFELHPEDGRVSFEKIIDQ